MRTDKELLEMLLKVVKGPDFKMGLCSAIDFTLSFGLNAITSAECCRLHAILKENKPVTRRVLYWWLPGHRAPRIEFLNNLILKYDGNIRKV